MPINPLLDMDMAVRSEELFQGKSEPFEANDLIEFPVAVVTDIATSIFNSFAPESIELSTEDTLRKINDDIADFYINHRQGVEITSFIGGLFVPGMLATKAINLAKAGKLGLAGRPVQFFDNRIAKSKDRALQLISEGQGATTAYLSARRAIRGNALGQGIVEGIAFESSLALMLQGHAYLEDYDVTDFLIGTAIGAAFAPLRSIWETRSFKTLAQSLEADAIGNPLAAHTARTYLGTKEGTENLGQKVGLQAHYIRAQKDALEQADLNPQAHDAISTQLLKAQANNVDLVVSMLSEKVKRTLFPRRFRTGQPIQIIGDEESVFDTDAVGQILRLVNKNALSLDGVDKINPFDTASAIAKDAAVKLQSSKVVKREADLDGTTDYGLVSIENGTLEDARKLLRIPKKQAAKDLDATFKSLVGRGIDDIFNGGKMELPDGTEISLTRQEDVYRLTIFDDDSKIFIKGDLRTFVEAIMQHMDTAGAVSMIEDILPEDKALLASVTKFLENVGARLDIDIRYTKADGTSNSRLSKAFDTLKQKSEKVTDFLLDKDITDSALTHAQLTGEAPAAARQFLAATGAVDADTGRLIATKHLDDLDTSAQSLIEIPENFKIATREDLESIANELSSATFITSKELAALDFRFKSVNQFTEAEIEFLRRRGFHGVEASMPDRRVTHSLATLIFEKGVKQIDSAVDREKLRIAGKLPSFDQEFAIFAPSFGKVLQSSQAALVMGAADIAGGYRRNPNYIFNPRTPRQLDPEAQFLPLRWASHIIDSQYLDAIAALPARGFGGALRISVDDLPRLNAVSLREDLIKKVKLLNTDGSSAFEGIISKEILQGIIEDSKIRWTRRLVDRGFSVEQIFRYTNTPIDTIENVIASGFDKSVMKDFASKELFWSVYDSTNIERFLRPKMLKLDGKALDFKDILRQKQIAKSDADLLAQASRALVESVSAKGADIVPVIGQWHDIVIGQPFRMLASNIGKFFSKEGLGPTTLTSRDFAIRRYGELGDIVASVADDFIRTVDSFITRPPSALPGTPPGVLDILTPAFNAIAADKTGVGNVLFNELYKSVHKVTDDLAKDLEYDPVLRKIITKRGDPEKDIPTEYLKYVRRDGNFGDEDIVINHDAVHNLMENVWPEVQRTMKTLINTNRALLGKPPVAERGIWFSYNTTEDKHKAYLFDGRDDKKTRLVVGSSAADLEEKLTAIRREITDPNIEIVRSSDVRLFNKLSGYEATEELRRADATLKSSGILVEGTSASPQIFNDILNSIQADIWRHARTYLRLAGHEVFDPLEAFTRAAQGSELSSARTFFQRATTKVDPGTVISKTLLNQSLLSNNQALGAVNNTYSWMIERAAENVTSIMKSKKAGEEDWLRISKELTAGGYPQPWENWEQFARDQSAPVKADARAIVAKINSIFVTLNLRLFETAHAALTTMTLPIVLSAELQHLGGQKFPLAYMMRGVRSLFARDEEHVQRRAVALAKGYSTRTTAEVTEVMSKMTSGQGIISKLEDNMLFRIATSASDTTERLTRELAYSTGYEIALDKFGRGQALEMYETFANSFTKRVMGNYTSRQRPVMFQGTFGATFGLYQTFMLTMGQNIFRYLEAADLRALTTLAGTQSGMYGISSLPFFDPISTAIGSYVTNDHSDLTSVAFELFGNTDEQSRSLAEFVLYGAPSALAQSAVFTRGTLDPRAPFSATSREGIALLPPALSILGQLYESTTQAASTVNEIATVGGSPVDISRALGEALSAQSIWRPGARWAELLVGHSIDRTGKVIDADTEFKADWATIARVMAVRPLKEEVLRRLNYTNDYYAALDQRRRKDSIRALRSLAIGESATPDNMAKIFQRYIDNGGSFQGWKQNLNEALLSVGNQPAIVLGDTIRRNTPIEKIFQGYID